MCFDGRHVRRGACPPPLRGCDLNHNRNIEVVRSYVRGLGIELLCRFAEFEHGNIAQCFASTLRRAAKLNGEPYGPCLQNGDANRQA